MNGLDQRKEFFISSTSEDLSLFRAAASQVVLELGGHPVMMEHFGATPGGITEVCRQKVSRCDFFVLIVAYRRGWVPSIAEGGDGQTSITAHEFRVAKNCRIPILVFLAEKTWPGYLWDEDPSGLAWLKDFRASLNQIATTFEYENSLSDAAGETLTIFKSKVRKIIISYTNESTGIARSTTQRTSAVRLRVRTQLTCAPSRPYCLLEPYNNPITFGGRAAEISELNRLALLNNNILGIYALSGAGKTSLISAGLVPELISQEIPFAYTANPTEANLIDRLLKQIFKSDVDNAFSGITVDKFRALMQSNFEATQKAPILILDQFEDCFKSDDCRKILALLGPIMASTVQYEGDAQQLTCKWLLSYRQDFHGVVASWLGDVLKFAKESDPDIYSRLPFNLREHGRFQAWPVPLFGEALPGVDSKDAAIAAFRDGIGKPLALRREDNRPLYGLAMSDQDMERLAEAFAETRLARPSAPLVPELQVVLNHLVDKAPASLLGSKSIFVPENIGATIERALEDHLKKSLVVVFPPTRDTTAREGRTRAILALRQLADAEGRRTAGLPEDVLAIKLGPNGREILETLASSAVRVIVPEASPEGLKYTLSHDRMAAVISNLLKDPALRAQYDIDEGIVQLRTLVARRSELYETTADPQELKVGRSKLRKIEQNEPVLITDDSRRSWWNAAKASAILRRKRKFGYIAAGLIIVPPLLSLAVLGPVGSAWVRSMLWAAISGPEASVSTAIHKAEAKKSQLATALVGKLSSGPSSENLNAWSVAQMVAALAAANLAESLDTKEIFGYFNKRKIQACECWYETNPESPQAAPTAWVLIALAKLGLKAEDGVIEKLLERQKPDGWWSMKIPAANDVTNASVSATALSIFAIQEQLKLRNLGDPIASMMEISKNRGLQWLVSHKKIGKARWEEYPLGSTHITTDYSAISGLALFVLRYSNFPQVKEISSQWVDALPFAPPAQLDTEQSKAQLSLLDPSFAKPTLDEVRHYKFAWSLPATADALEGSLWQRSAAAVWLINALGKDLSSNALNNQEWAMAELLFSLNYTINKVKTRMKGN